METKQDYVIKQIATYWSHDSLSLFKIWTCLVKLFLSYSRNNPTLTNIWMVLSLTVHWQLKHCWYFQLTMLPSSLKPYPQILCWYQNSNWPPITSVTCSWAKQHHCWCNITAAYHRSHCYSTWLAPRILSTPSSTAGGSKKMITSNIHTRQPSREVWSLAHLHHEHAIALGQSIDTSTWHSYSSALNSYLDLIRKH